MGKAVKLVTVRERMSGGCWRGVGGRFGEANIRWYGVVEVGRGMDMGNYFFSFSFFN